MPFGRWLGDFEPLSKVEKQLLEHCAHGATFIIGPTLPQKPLAGNRIRAGIIRFLLLGGDDLNPVHEAGVMVQGAWIEDELDLRQACCRVSLLAQACHFDKRPIAVQAKIPELVLRGSSTPGLAAHGLIVEGRILLDRGFSAAGEVGLVGADIGDHLTCTGGSFSNKDGPAISADRLKVGGGVFMDDGFVANAEVRMLGANIGGGLYCDAGAFCNKKNFALNLDGAVINDCLFFRDSTLDGVVNLTTAFAGTLVDDEASYKEATLHLDGFRYDRILGPTSADFRIGWIRRQWKSYLKDDFKPQPWEQLIRVLRDMGHPVEAARIAMAKQEALRGAGQIGLRKLNPQFFGARLALDKGWSTFSNHLVRRAHWFYGWIAGYGYRPTRIIWGMVLACMLCSLAYYVGRGEGLFGPTSPVLQMSAQLSRCGPASDPGAISWTSADCRVPPEYSTFQPFLYSVDVILPFVDLHQEADWGPIVANTRGETLWVGRILRWIMWFEIVFGWVASLMLVAIVGRLVDKD